MAVLLLFNEEIGDRERDSRCFSRIFPHKVDVDIIDVVFQIVVKRRIINRFAFRDGDIDRVGRIIRTKISLEIDVVLIGIPEEIIAGAVLAVLIIDKRKPELDVGAFIVFKHTVLIEVDFDFIDDMNLFA